MATLREITPTIQPPPPDISIPLSVWLNQAVGGLQDAVYRINKYLITPFDPEEGLNVIFDSGNFTVASGTVTINDTGINHNGLTNTHNLTTHINHDSITNTHNLTTDINHNSVSNLTAGNPHTQYLRKDGTTALTDNWSAGTKNITTTGNGTFGQIYDSGLTAGRIPYITTDGQLVDSSNLLWDNTNQRLRADGVIWSYGTTGSTPMSGAGSRFMWIPAKSALRAGYVDSGQWNDENIGSYSVAFGYNCTASGDYSFAGGTNCTASANWGFAFGDLATAVGQCSFVFGNICTATNAGSISMGQLCNASGLLSVAIGDLVTASGTRSSVFGYNVENSTASSFAVGFGAIDLLITSNNANFQDCAIVTTGTLGAGAITGTSLTDGTATLDDGALSGITTIGMSGQLTNTLATGTAPFVIASTTVNTNLNADLWDGYQFGDYLDQAVKQTSSPTFADLAIGNYGTADFGSDGEGGDVTFYSLTSDEGSKMYWDASYGANNGGLIFEGGATPPYIVGARITEVEIGISTIDATAIGATVPSTGAFTELSSTSTTSFPTGTTIGNLTLANGSITDSSGAISFGDENLITTGTLTIDGSIGIGSSPITDYGINIVKAINTAGGVIGVFGQMTNTNTATSPMAAITGFDFNAAFIPSAAIGGTGTRTVGVIQGAIVDIVATSYANETKNISVTNSYGFKPDFTYTVGAGATGALTAANVYEFITVNPTLVNGATITTLYGYYDVGMTTGGTNWGFYGLSAQNYLSGKLLLGQTDGTIGIYSQANGYLDLFADGGMRFGDSSAGAPTNYMNISPTGNVSFAGSAGFYPVRIAQSAQPTPDTGELIIWQDTDDSKVYLVYNDTDSGVKQVEMV